MVFKRPCRGMAAAVAVGLLCATASALQPVAALGLDGKPVDPLAASRGKIVVLVFVRTDCPISNRYAPTLQRLSSQYANQATFYLVYPDRSESVATIEKHLAQYSYKLSALRDPRQSLVKLAQVKITPEAAVFDSQGVLAYHGRIDNWYEAFGRARPAPTTHDLDDAIKALLNGGRPASSSTEAVGCYISDLE